MDFATTEEIAKPRSNAKRWQQLLAYALALVALVWVFHDLHPRQLLPAMVIRHWWWVAAAVCIDVLTYVLQGMRWSVLLSPVGKLAPLRSTEAIYAGLFTNEVLPLRLGEVVRAYLASHWIGARTTAVLPSMLVERFLDALWLAVGIAFAASVVPLPGKLIDAGDVLGGVVLLAAVLFAWVVFRREKRMESGEEGDAGFVTRFAAGVKEIGVSRKLLVAAFLSAGMLACQALAAWFMMLSLDIRLSLSAATTVMVIVRLGTAIPNAPANTGSFQFFTVLPMGLFGVDKTIAAAYSVVDFVALTAPLWILGLIAVGRTGMSFRTLKSEVMRRAA